jgi:hypothetical protein
MNKIKSLMFENMLKQEAKKKKWDFSRIMLICCGKCGKIFLE